jgi:hypothetical protein
MFATIDTRMPVVTVTPDGHAMFLCKAIRKLLHDGETASGKLQTRS